VKFILIVPFGEPSVRFEKVRLLTLTLLSVKLIVLLAPSLILKVPLAKSKMVGDLYPIGTAIIDEVDVEPIAGDDMLEEFRMICVITLSANTPCCSTSATDCAFALTESDKEKNNDSANNITPDIAT
jgi:hypothetical protein